MIKIKTKNRKLAKIIWSLRKIPFVEVITTQYPKESFFFGIWLKGTF